MGDRKEGNMDSSGEKKDGLEKNVSSFRGEQRGDSRGAGLWCRQGKLLCMISSLRKTSQRCKNWTNLMKTSRAPPALDSPAYPTPHGPVSRNWVVAQSTKVVFLAAMTCHHKQPTYQINTRSVLEFTAQCCPYFFAYLPVKASPFQWTLVLDTGQLSSAFKVCGGLHLLRLSFISFIMINLLYQRSALRKVKPYFSFTLLKKSLLEHYFTIKYNQKRWKRLKINFKIK